MRRAVVIGAGIAGLAAAAAVRHHADQVVVVERDRLPDGPAPRSGVPQGNQLHNLLSQAQQHLEGVLPGFSTALRALGCGEACVSRDTYVHELGIRMPERDLGLRIMSASRPAIDHAARSVLAADETITFIDGRRVLDLIGDRSGVTGAVLAGPDDGTERLAADLVVDASGPLALAARWYGALGAEVPVDVDRPARWYVSVEVEPSVEHRTDSQFWMVFPTPPHTRGGLISPTGRGRWNVSLSGGPEDALPRTFEGMRTHAEGLEDPVIATLLDTAQACGPPRAYRRITAQWRRFDRHPVCVPGLFPIGDAVATLDPLFGQGISVAARQAGHLAQVLASQPDLAQATSRYHALAAEAVHGAWTLGPAVTRALEADVDGLRVDLTRALARVVQEDPAFHAHWVRVWHLLEPADSLRAAAVTRRLLAAYHAPGQREPLTGGQPG